MQRRSAHFGPCSVALIACLMLAPSSGCEKQQRTSSSSSSSSSGWTPEGPNADLPSVQMKIGSRTFTLFVADSPEEHRHGLMNRESMPRDHGMIFVFPSEQHRSFWMKDTLIPLDILYVSAAGRVMSVWRMEAKSLRGVPSGAPAKYAIELNAGTAAELGVETGDVLEIPQAARDPAEMTTEE